MSVVLDILGWAALLAGGFFTIVGAVGLQRMPDLFTRMHAVSVSDTLGVSCLVVGMLLQTDSWAVGVRLVIILLVIWAAGAVATHALARAALHDGQWPLLAGPEEGDDRVRPVDPAEIDPELARRLARPLTSERVEDRSGPHEHRRQREVPGWNS